MAEEIELFEVQDIPAEEGAGIDADNAEDAVIDFSWLSSMEEKLASASGPNSSPSFTICRVPATIRKCDHAAYDPQIVSIGPFHRGMENLQAMEGRKWRYVHEVLAFGEGRTNLEKFLKKMKEIETQARNCYSENIQMSSKEFVEMMVLDGCFVIFIVLQKIGLVETDVFISGNCWMPSPINLDMFLLENQLPFFVLDCLWELIGEPRATLRNVVLASFEDIFSYKLELKSPEEDVIHHLLHLLHLSLKPDSPTRKAQTYDRFRTPSQQSSPESEHASPKPWNVFPSATELQEAGVRFQLKQARSFFEVRFDQELMEISYLEIFDSTNILFRNFIAFEQCFPYCGHHFTSYCHFIDFLADTPRDVSILREAGIIRNGIGSNDEVALLFNKLCKGISWSVNGSYLADLFENVNQHTQKRRVKMRAILVHYYFSNPWAILCLLEAIIILILTFVQTFFSAFDEFSHPKS